MLDDLKMIHERDAQDALGIVEKQGQQLEHEFTIENGFQGEGIDAIVYAAMGGSALAAQISTVWPGYTVPFEIVRSYLLPAYVGPKTLVIAASYSGNTEETLSALEDAEQKGAQIAVIAGGGKLTEKAKEKGYALLTLPKAEQPRYAVLYNLKAIVALLEQTQLLNTKDAHTVLGQKAEFLHETVKPWIPTMPAAKNAAKQLAQEIMGRSPVVYAGPLLAPTAYKWKISFNENAKNVAWCGTLPEFNHNEFIGWSSHPPQKPYTVIDLRSNLEHPRVQKRFEISERLLSGKRPAAQVVEVQGADILEQLLWSLAFGDFVSIYLGLLNGVNPAPVELVERFKKEMEK